MKLHCGCLVENSRLKVPCAPHEELNRRMRQ